MKICDGADWFKAEFAATISDGLHEIARFHRKQWEFAAILNELSKAGALVPDAVGISFGAGQELPIYAIANHVRQIWATDLYTPDTTWPTARRDEIQDVTEFVRNGAPFATRKDAIQARSMDMRSLDFPDASFDFAYSSSAVEHIGGWSDFSRHLAEVRRVLKPGGLYVMTTDITFGPTTECPGNFKFSPERLEWWLKTSGMAYEPVVDCRIAHHYVNTPLPADIACYLTADSGRTHHNLFGTLAMAQNLTACHPNTSVILVMKKLPVENKPVEFIGFEETKRFLLQARDWVGTILEESALFPHPDPWIPSDLKSETWATTLMWLGGKSRMVRVKIVVDKPGCVGVGVNKAHADRYWQPEVELPESLHQIEREADFEFPLICDSAYTYAIYGRSLSSIGLKQVTVRIDDCREFDVDLAADAAAPVSSQQSLAGTARPKAAMKQAAKAALKTMPGIGPILKDRDLTFAELQRLKARQPPRRIGATLDRQD